MFKDCTGLTALDVSNWNTTNVIKMIEMFGGCSSLTELDLSQWDTNKASYDYYLMQNCSGLEKLSVSPTMESLDTDACKGVGTATKPCLLVVPSDFTFDSELDTSGDYFQWCSGYFTLQRLYYMGDVNHSGGINVSDVVSTVDYILGISTENFFIDRADMNGDNIINITDVVMMVDTILGIIPKRY